jgi:hypothetical protein
MLARQGVGEDCNKRLSFSTTDLRTDARKRVDISRSVLDRLVATADIIAPLGPALLNSASVSNSCELLAVDDLMRVAIDQRIDPSLPVVTIRVRDFVLSLVECR